MKTSPVAGLVTWMYHHSVWLPGCGPLSAGVANLVGISVPALGNV